MLDLIAKLTGQLVDFSKISKKNTEEIKKLYEKVSDLTDEVIELKQRIHLMEAREKDRQEILILQLKNILLENGIRPPQSLNDLPQLPKSNETKSAE